VFLCGLKFYAANRDSSHISISVTLEAKPLLKATIDNSTYAYLRLR